MFERFTDRARKAMALANQEAQRFSHEYVGTEHILLGIVKEGSGVAANILRRRDIDLRLVRLEVKKLVKDGPDIVTMGKLPQTPRTKRAIEFAIEEARDLGHNYVGTEHLLLGLLKEANGVALVVLTKLGVSLIDARLDVRELVGPTAAPTDIKKPIKPMLQHPEPEEYLFVKFDVATSALRELIAAMSVNQATGTIQQATQLLSDLELLRVAVADQADAT